MKTRQIVESLPGFCCFLGKMCVFFRKTIDFPGETQYTDNRNEPKGLGNSPGGSNLKGE